MESKSPITSRTLWVNFIAAIISLLMVVGIDLGLDGEQQAAIVTVILAIVNFVLRLLTDKKVKMKGD